MRLTLDIISLLPEIIQPTLAYGVVGRAYQKELFEVKFWNPRHYTYDRHHTVDGRPYGGGPGMVMLYEPLKKTFDAISSYRESRGVRIFLSPQGQVLTQKYLKTNAYAQHIILLCGRYEGVDQRLLDAEIDYELSVGDYILSGGELAAAILVDGLVRLLPGALSNQESHENDSFSLDGQRLDHPHYARPREINGLLVPEVLFSGDHEEIAKWRLEAAEKKTVHRQQNINNNNKDAEIKKV